MHKIKHLFYITIFFITLVIYSTILFANPKIKIIDSVTEIKTLKFNFNQFSSNSKNIEVGICYLAKPHFLNCLYNDKVQKQIIVNRKNLVIFHRKFKKLYNYPATRSYFLDILDNKKFSDLINKGKIKKNKNNFELEYFNKDKGKITIYFDEKNYNLNGWKVVSLNKIETIFKIENLSKNIELDKRMFKIPDVN